VKFDANSPLNASISRGFEYSDCWVDDARLVVLNAMAARENGAHIHTRTRCLNARRVKGMWHLHMERADGSLFSVHAKALVNAAGPWVAKFIREDLKLNSPYGIRLIQGSHLIVPKLYDGENAFILQNEDKRIVFTIPYLEHFTIVGTTDREYQGDPAKVKITEGEMDYVLKVANDHFKKQLTRADVIHTYSGVRPLCNDESDNPSAITRDYTLSLSGGGDEAPILSVFGGKLTTYRKLAESAMAQLAPFFKQMKPSWTATKPLPGGEEMTTPAELATELTRRFGWLPAPLAKRWSITYGSRSWRLLDGVQSLEDMGQHLGAGLYTREVDYLCETEWATAAEDILWRRSKLGLFMTPEEQAAVQTYLETVVRNKAAFQAA
jgi:glycerol-3-phosphate dehydrogenase